MDKRTVPYLALGGAYGHDDTEAVSRVVESAARPGGNFFPLPEEADFQEQFALHEGAERAVAVNSAGTALDLCMMALDVGPGDEVITTPLTFVCSATTAMARGARVIFADIDPVTLNLDPASVEQMVTERTRAIIPVHFAGLACDCDGFERIAGEKGLDIIYDAAHAVCAKYRGDPVGGFGTASCYSFQSNKNMTTLGEGGAVTTNNQEFAETVRQMKTFGYIYGKPPRVVRIGFNYRMTKVQLATGINQLGKIDDIVAAKRRMFRKMNDALENIDEIIIAPEISDDHACLMYVARLRSGMVSFEREDLLDHLRREWGVGTVVHYPPVWSWEVMQESGYTGDGCPYAAEACATVFSLPVFPSTTEDDIAYIAYALKESISALR